MQLQEFYCDDFTVREYRLGNLIYKYAIKGDGTYLLGNRKPYDSTDKLGRHALDIPTHLDYMIAEKEDELSAYKLVNMYDYPPTEPMEVMNYDDGAHLLILYPGEYSFHNSVILDYYTGNPVEQKLVFYGRYSVDLYDCDYYELKYEELFLRGAVTTWEDDVRRVKEKY